MMYDGHNCPTHSRVAEARRRLVCQCGSGYHADRSDNELATRHPFDCGRSRCLVCHASKILHGGSRRAQQKREARRAQSP